MHVFLIQDAVKKDEPTDVNELVTIELLTPKEILKSIDKGDISCSLCIAASLRAARRLGW